jgi:magnesium chelatase accessory protein
LALEMSKSLPLKGVVGLNPALSKFPGLAGVMFPMMAKMMALNPLTPRYLAGLAKSKSRVRQILSGTGSDLAEDQINLYQKLFSDKTHVKGTILMMSQWNLDRLLAQLNTVDTPCLLIASTRDRTVPCADVKATAERMRNTAYHELNGLGHLAHEEDPQKVAGLLSAFFKQKRAALSQTSA